jgi:NADPH2:quinone reductase
VLTPDELELGDRPLEKAKFGGAVDNIGGEILSGLLRHISLWGNVASIGLAQSSELHGTVMPHILRGVSILGISSANCPIELRRELWNRLGGDLRPRHLEQILHQEITLEQVKEVSEKMIARQIVGRTIVRLGGENVG